MQNVYFTQSPKYGFLPCILIVCNTFNNSFNSLIQIKWEICEKMSTNAFAFSDKCDLEWRSSSFKLVSNWKPLEACIIIPSLKETGLWLSECKPKTFIDLLVCCCLFKIEIAYIRFSPLNTNWTRQNENGLHQTNKSQQYTNFHWNQSTTLSDNCHWHSCFLTPLQPSVKVKIISSLIPWWNSMGHHTGEIYT